MSKAVRIALIGAGWMGQIHSEAYCRLQTKTAVDGVGPELRWVVDVDEPRARRLMDTYGYSNCSDNWQEVIARNDVDLVDVCVHNSLHRDIVLASARAGKHLLCEKPLATNPQAADEMVRAVEAAGVVHMINFNYRRVPAIAFARELLRQGELGAVYQIRALFAQDFAANPELPVSWRFSPDLAGGGSLVTMGSHALDLMRWLMGNVTTLVSMTSTLVPDRPVADEEGRVVPGRRAKISVDDATSIMARFASGAAGSLETTWLAHGRKHHLEFELYGSRGALHFNSERLNELRLCDATVPLARRGFTTILVGEPHPYGGEFMLKTGMGIGIKETFLLQLEDLIAGVAGGVQVEPNFRDGLEVDRLIAAALESAKLGQWVKV
jgi:predicted dehydrogenase